MVEYFELLKIDLFALNLAIKEQNIAWIHDMIEFVKNDAKHIKVKKMEKRVLEVIKVLKQKVLTGKWKRDSENFINEDCAFCKDALDKLRYNEEGKCRYCLINHKTICNAISDIQALYNVRIKVCELTDSQYDTIIKLINEI